MYDVNPLGPMMHLKQIEREALARCAATAKGGAGTLLTGARIMGALKRLFTSLGPEVSVDGRFNAGRQ
jgi:hypothetical protein